MHGAICTGKQHTGGFTNTGTLTQSRHPLPAGRDQVEPRRYRRDGARDKRGRNRIAHGKERIELLIAIGDARDLRAGQTGLKSKNGVDYSLAQRSKRHDRESQTQSIPHGAGGQGNRRNPRHRL